MPRFRPFFLNADFEQHIVKQEFFIFSSGEINALNFPDWN
jgi:hypothetical protein